MSTWVFLRGLMRDQRHWGDFVEAFQGAMPQAHIVLLDLPGNGERYLEDSPANVAAMVRACRAGLQERGIPGPYCVLALSLGAMVATAWSASYPDEIVAAVLINTSMRPHGRFYQRLRWQNYGPLAALVLGRDIGRQEETLLRLTSNRHRADTALRAAWVDFQRQFPVRRANALRQLLAAARFRAPHCRPAMPVLLLASAADHLVNAACSERLALAWRVPLRLHPDAGHDLPLDDGPWVAQCVSAWFSSAFQ